MARNLSIFHRRPRTRRERMGMRLHQAHQGLSDRWAHLRATRRARATHHRMQEVWQHLAHDAHAERAAHGRRARLPHPHRRHR